MACSKYEYVRQYEQQVLSLPNTYMVVRIDGKGFSKFTNLHNFEKPNDLNGLNLMNKAAKTVMEQFDEIFLAYGQSDEYSFVFRRDAQLYNRRNDKIISTIVSCFTGAYIYHFPDYFREKKLLEIPMFDSRIILYPTVKSMRDYLNWRQVDCHINNLYNTCFWMMVQKDGVSQRKAGEILGLTNSGQKNEILFSKYNMNYNNIEQIYRKGSIIIRQIQQNVEKQMGLCKIEESQIQQDQLIKQDYSESDDQMNEKNEIINVNKNEKQHIIELRKQKKLIKQQKKKQQCEILILNEDLIQDAFWQKYENSLDCK